MKTENDMIKKLVQDELEKEAEQIKREMEQEPKLSEGVPSPEMKSTIWRRAEEIRRQKEAYDNLSEADKEALRLGREIPTTSGRKRERGDIRRAGPGIPGACCRSRRTQAQ
ncbi:hypothetical protein [Sellimonas intestinalis]|uniref:hypothetical protein n=1 Tax=Sellimonas intestinalis TaxID=1653434 RepID=UPI0039954533